MNEKDINIYDDQDDQNNADETTSLDNADVTNDESETEDVEVNATPLASQADEEDIEEFMTASTNLSLDQLKEEGGPHSSVDDTEETTD